MIIFTANQIASHFIGDYILQSHWMAIEKKNSIFVAALHAAFYSIPFFFLTDMNLAAWFAIWFTHTVIDHFSLAKYIVFASNYIAPKRGWPVWEECKNNGYDTSTPIWLSTWLLIITDNTCHVICNALALQYLN